MNLTRQFLAPVAVQDAQNKVISVDLSAFLLRLFLFDTYILQSVWLDDLYLLIDAFGAEGLTLLLQENALKLYCESYAIGETGRARADLNFTDNNKRLPLGSYSYSVIRVRGQDERIRHKIDAFAQAPGVSPAARLYLAGEIEKHLILMPDAFSKTVFDGFYSDLRTRPEVVKNGLEAELKRLGLKPKRLRSRIEECEPEDFRLVTNMQDAYGLSETMVHQIGDRVLMALAHLNWKMAVMQTHSALVGINEADQQLLYGKLGLLAELVQPSVKREAQFQRVISLFDVPVARLGHSKLDAEKLLRLRESDDLRAFRDWLAHTDDLTDRQIEDRMAGFRATLKAALTSTYGRVIRFIVSNGLQFAVTATTSNPVAGQLASLGIDALDTFLLERLTPKDTILSFLGDEYPSVFKR
ncbi:MAG TPA: hypothetical protein VGK36_15520 [Candidatus Angelobacter sp.]